VGNIFEEVKWVVVWKNFHGEGDRNVKFSVEVHHHLVTSCRAKDEERRREVRPSEELSNTNVR
jgi:hypothetical protein